MAVIVNRKEGHILYKPFNEWDMNWHLVEEDTRYDYLIDIDDIRETTEELEEYGGVLETQLRELTNIWELKEAAWLIKDSEGNKVLKA